MPSPLLPNRCNGHRFVLKRKDEDVLRELQFHSQTYQINAQGFVEVHDVFGLPVDAVDVVSGDYNFV